MCDNCKNELENQDMETTEELNEEVLDDRLMDLTLDKEYDRLSRRFLFDDESLELLIQTSEFQEGQQEALKLCGMYSTLISFGIDEDKAYELVINQQTIDHNLVNARINADMNIEMSKNQVITFEKNQP